MKRIAIALAAFCLLAAPLQAQNLGVSAYVDKSGDTLSLIFDTTAVMKIIKSINSVYNNSTLSTIASILNQYDEMYAGFRLKK